MARSEMLTESLEDYLEAIFDIIAEQEAVRPKNIADRLGVSQPSVTGALQVLAKKKLIRYEPYGIITLTPEGREVAESVAERHILLRRFLIDILRVEKKEANDVACKMEHILPSAVWEKFAAFIDYVAQHQKECAGWKFDKKKARAKRQ